MRFRTAWGPLLPVLVVLMMAGIAEGGPRPLSLRRELQQRQGTDGLSLLLVDKGAVWQLDFKTGRLRELVKFPKELAAFPEEWQDLSNYALDWPHKRLAGLGDRGLFVADLGTGQVKWYHKVLGANAMSFSHRVDRLAFASFGWVYVVDLSTGTTKEVAAGMSEVTIPQWSPDDTQLLFHTAAWKVVLADLKTGKKRIIGEGEFATWGPVAGRITLWREIECLTVSPTGDEEKHLLRGDDVCRLLRYSPDGKYAVYERGWWADVNIKGHEYGEVAVVRLSDKKTVAVYGHYKRGGIHRGNALPLTWAYVKPDRKPEK
jgi:hypothetical protein